MGSLHGDIMDRFEFFKDMPKTEAGAATFTSAYLTPVPIKKTDKLLDLACSSGDRAVWIARSRGSHVIACDKDERYLPIVMKRAEAGGSKELVETVCAEYLNLPFEEGSFKVVIAENVAMETGLARGLEAWRRFPRADGYLAVTYPGIINKNAPVEIREPLERRMVESMGTMADYQNLIRSSGFEIVHQYPLATNIWDRFYLDNMRHAWALVNKGVVPESDPVVKDILAEARWYHNTARGRLFYHAFLLKRCD